MQLKIADETLAPSAGEVAEYAAAMAGELALMARQAGLDALARALDDTRRAAEAQLGNAAPEDAA